MKRVINIILVICLIISHSAFKASANYIDEEEQYVDNELIASVASLEEAENVAAYYGITLTSYAYGIAIFSTLDTEYSVIQSQTYSDMPTLYQNRIYTLYEEEIIVQSVDWEYSSIQYFHDDIHTSSAWESATGEGVKVAIIDTGVDTDHEALTHALSDDRSYNSYTLSDGLNAVEDDNGHGTHVAGIVAATGTRYDVYGVAPNADLIIVKANIDSSETFTVASLSIAVNYAVAQNADIINLSLGASYSYGEYVFEKEIFDNAVEAGVTVICAAGNDSDSHAAYPAAYDSTIAVSAVKQGFEFDDSYSSYGPEIDVSAPGTHICSTYYDGGYAYGTGTSMASPVVAGVAALIISADLDEDYTPEEIRKILCETDMEAGDLDWDQYYGYGIVNAYSAVLGIDELYEVTYYDENEILATTYVAPDDCLIEPNEIDGEYDFLGWTTTLYGTDIWDFSTPVTEDLELYAYFDLPEGIYATDGDDETTVVVVYSPENALDEAQIILAFYENGQMKTCLFEEYDYTTESSIRIVSSCSLDLDEVKVFVLDDKNICLAAMTSIL